MRSLPRSSFVLSLALGALLLGGCRLKPFSELEDSAPVLSLDAIDGYPSGRFGEVFAAYGGSTSLGGVGRIAGSAGAGSPFLVFDVWTGGEIGSLNVRFDGCDDIPEDCEEGAGAALAHVPVWRGMRDCVLLSATRIGVGPSETEGTLRIQCEETAATTERLQRVSGVGFGTDLAALPEGHPLGAAIIGAPEAAGGGALYRLPQDGIAPVELDLPAMLTLSEGAGLGTALAVAPLPDDAFALDGAAALVLAAAPGEERVVVLAVGEADDGMTGVPQTTARLLGCLDGSAMRSPSAPLDQGSGMAAGDLDGDGMPEVIVGDAAAGSVRVARLADLGMAAGCGTPSDSDDPTTTTISCPSVEGVGCEGFGASAAVGDFDADG
ncbi:MAG TPA: hypothetical protein RMH26_13940, partial [Polyangiaceae bacterium LLY-WYZ-15_(1-7)]|nr:hypothetical protein [Polyangiaceae bacterium LLY-WYZ-15_(1-7)]